MRYILLIMIVLNLSADYLVIVGKKAYCSTEYAYENGRLYYVRSQDLNTYSARGNTQILTGYEYNATNNLCQLNSFTQRSGLSFELWNTLFAYAGLLTGFSFLFWGLFLTIKVAS